jgi:hypothetical protein
VFGKQDNTNTIDLSDIASTTKITPWFIIDNETTFASSNGW